MQEEEQTITDILSSIRQVLSKEAATLNNETPVQKNTSKSTDTVFELTPQMQISSGLVTPQTALKTQASLEKLDAFKEYPSEQKKLEKELEPFLKAWLNDHLPDIVERVVTREVQRIINRN